MHSLETLFLKNAKLGTKYIFWNKKRIAIYYNFFKLVNRANIQNLENSNVIFSLLNSIFYFLHFPTITFASSMANNVVILFPVYGEKKTQSFLWVHHSLVVMHAHFQDHCRLWERKLEQRKEWSLAVIKYHLRTVQITEAVRPQCWAPLGPDGLCCRRGRPASPSAHHGSWRALCSALRFVT